MATKDVYLAKRTNKRGNVAVKFDREWIRRRLGELEMTQKDFAKACNRGQRCVTRWLAGESWPDYSDQVNIALALHLDESYVFAKFAAELEADLGAGTVRAPRMASGWGLRGALSLSAVLESSGYKVEDVAFLSGLDGNLVASL